MGKAFLGILLLVPGLAMAQSPAAVVAPMTNGQAVQTTTQGISDTVNADKNRDKQQVQPPAPPPAEPQKK